MATSIVSSSKNTWGFSPQSIPGLALWLDGADTTSMTFGSGSNVSSWRDKSGKGLNVSTAANFPVYTSTGVQFNGTPLSNTTGGYSATTAFTAFIVYRSTGSGGRSRPFVTSYNGNNVFVSIDNTYIDLSTPTTYKYNAMSSFSENTTYVISAVSYTSNSLAYAVNGTESFVWTNSSGPAPPAVTQLLVGVNAGANFTGFIMEIVLYDAYFTETQRQQVEGYLAAKWGLTMQLPATHPYSAVVPFLPTQIAGCQLWLDAADSSTITGTSPVTAWADKSGNGNNATPISGATPTLSNINGVPAIVPGGGGFTGSITSGTPTLSYFGVAVFDSETYGSMASLAGPGYADVGTISGCALFNRSGNENLLYCTRADSNTSPNLALASNAVFLASVVFNSTNTTVAYLNGGTSTSTMAGRSQSFGYTQFCIGSRLFGTTPSAPYWTGRYGEIIIYNAALSTSQRNQVEQYLGQKWKIAVANAPSPGSYLIPTNRPFYPTDISGCQLWLDGGDRSSMTFSGGTNTITQWNDKSGNGNNGIATGSPALTQTGINGRQAVTAAVGTCFLGPISMTGQSLTCFGVATTDVTLPNVRSPRADQRLVSLANGTNPDYQSNGMIPLFNQDSTSTIAAWSYNYGPGTLASNPIVTGTPFMAVSRLDGTTASLWFNGSAGTLASSSFSSSVTATKYGIGNQANPTIEYWSGFIGEVILFNTALSTSQRQQVEQYLAQKWGLVANLPTGHPGKLMPAFSTGFTPKSLTGMRWWVDGMDTSTMTFSSGSNITEWRDKSGNAYHATGVNSPQKLSSGGVSFNSASSQRFSMSVPYSNTNTMFMVASPVPSTTDSMYYIGQNNPNYCGAMFVGGYNSSYVASFYPANPSVGGSPSQIPVLSAGLPTTPFLVSSVKTAAVSAVGYYNGSGAYSQGDTATAGPTFWDNVGAASQGYNHLTANIYELIFFSVALTNSQRQQVEGYLAWKWGLQSSLPSTHAYAKFSP